MSIDWEENQQNQHSAVATFSIMGHLIAGARFRGAKMTSSILRSQQFDSDLLLQLISSVCIFVKHCAAAYFDTWSIKSLPYFFKLVNALSKFPLAFSK